MRGTNIGVKEYFTILVALLFLIDLSIVINVPFLRQIFGFLYFTTIPGLLFLHILKFNTEFLKKIILSVGLSIAFLMFAGLIMNSFYPIIKKPLSLSSLLIFLNLFLIILAFIAYNRNRNDFDMKDVFNIRVDLENKLISPLLFPLLFPFLAVFGAYLMNVQGNNIILLITHFLIPVYVVTVVILKDRISENTYPLAIFMIGLSLLLMKGIRGINIPYGDTPLEYYTFKLTLSNSHWSISNFYYKVNACLSVTILPTIYSILLNIDVIIYRIIYPIFLSIIPLGSYIIFKNYLKSEYAFLSSFLIISQHIFIKLMDESMRQIIGFLFFILIFMVILDDKIDNLGKKILLVIFIIALIFSHYAMTYTFFAILVIYLIITLKGKHHIRVIDSITPLFLFVTSFFWYGQITGAPFTNTLNFIVNAVEILMQLSIESFKSERAFIVGAELLATKITVLVYHITIITITIGVINLIYNYIKIEKHYFYENYLFLIFSSWILLLISSLPTIFFKGYNIARVLLPLLIFLAPAFVVGGEAYSKGIMTVINRFKPKMNVNLDQHALALKIITLLLIIQFFAGTYMIFQILGVHWSEVLNNDGVRYERYFVHQQDVATTQWLSDHKINMDVWGDHFGSILYLRWGPPHDLPLGAGISHKKEIEGYIFLRWANVKKKAIYPGYGEKPKSIKDFSQLFNGPKIYDNGGGEVYIYRR